MSAESILKMEKLFFDEIKYKREITSDTPPQEFRYNFTRSITPRDDNHFIVSLQCNIETVEDRAFSLQVRATGWFQCEEENEDIKRTLISENAIAIIFPYLRSEISLITTQPDIMPIILPAMNINALFKDNGEIEK